MYFNGVKLKVKNPQTTLKWEQVITPKVFLLILTDLWLKQIKQYSLQVFVFG